MNKYKYKIGILGGTFDPAHTAHIKISKEAKKKFGLRKVFWVVTKKNPFKKKSYFSLNERLIYAKKINRNNKFIKVCYLEKKINSRKTINILKYFNKSYKNSEMYFIMGADNLINFHKWFNWKKILEICNILVFDRTGYKAKSLKSVTFKKFNKKGLQFIKFKKVNISSSQLRNI